MFVMFCILQVALLKEERSNLMVENEELYGKVREAQTLSRKDSVKAKQLETEVDHLKDEFDRLRALYVSTREHMDSMEVSVTLHYTLRYQIIPAVKLFTSPPFFSQTMERPGGGGGVNFATYCSLFPDVFVEADPTRGLERRRGNAAIERRDGGHQDRAHRSQSFLREVSLSVTMVTKLTSEKVSGCEGSGKVSIALTTCYVSY